MCANWYDTAQGIGHTIVDTARLNHCSPPAAAEMLLEKFISTLPAHVATALKRMADSSDAELYEAAGKALARRN